MTEEKNQVGKSKNWFARHKVVTIILIIFLFGFIVSVLDEASRSQDKKATPSQNNDVAKSEQAAENAVTATNQATQQQAVKEISYEIVDRWDIPNGGEGQAIVISPDNLNEAYMELLGEQLKQDNLSNRNSFVWVFDNIKAANLRSDVLSDSISEEDLSFYDQHYVGQYNKNANTGFHQFVIYFDGVVGSNKKTIQY